MNELEYSQFKEFIYKLIYETMTLDDYELIMRRLEIPNPIKTNSKVWMYKSFCHNENAYSCKNNLAFYTEERSYYCFSECQISYNIITLVEKRFDLLEKKKTRFQVVKWICEQLNVPFDFKSKDIEKDTSHLYNWHRDIDKYIKGKLYQNNLLKEYDKSILNYFEPIYHQSWLDDNISIEVMEQYGIKYYPYHDSIIIPCFQDNKLIGIRERFINPNSSAKYLPLELCDGTSYTFPVNQTLYGLNYNNNNIQHYKKIVLGESEKFTLQCATYFGYKNFSASLYGKSMSNSKLKQILELGVEEVIIALDFDYEKIGDNKEFNAFKKNIYRIGKYFKPYCKVSALVSYEGHKINDSPTDNGKKWYMDLYNNREYLYE